MNISYDILIYVVIIVFLLCRCRQIKSTEYMADLCGDQYCNDDKFIDHKPMFDQVSKNAKSAKETNQSPSKVPNSSVITMQSKNQYENLSPPLSTIKSNVKNISKLKKTTA